MNFILRAFFFLSQNIIFISIFKLTEVKNKHLKYIIIWSIIEGYLYSSSESQCQNIRLKIEFDFLGCDCCDYFP